ncbi:unnamed protein product [Arctia plantaginis]|uniref:Uncharacterized protein n=1 Tax=Arctia plantaginis TaxID=874455 RepID=A0A8S1A7J7_ARCPL|nr:unnamed protein product [Arctia plantaginis]
MLAVVDSNYKFIFIDIGAYDRDGFQQKDKLTIIDDKLHSLQPQDEEMTAANVIRDEFTSYFVSNRGSLQLQLQKIFIIKTALLTYYITLLALKPIRKNVRRLLRWLLRGMLLPYYNDIYVLHEDLLVLAAAPVLHL